MPPKKRVTARKTAEPSLSQMFRSIPSIAKIYDEVGAAYDNAAGAILGETLKMIVAEGSKLMPGCSHEQLHALFGGKMENTIADMIIRKPISDSTPETSSKLTRASSKAKISVKKELEEHTDIITDSIAEEEEETERDPDDLYMETDDNDVTPTAGISSNRRMATPPINAQMTDEEFEELAIPGTLRRMEQMSISRKAALVSSASRTTVTTCHGTPKRVMAQVKTQPVTPRHVFVPTTPGRAAAPKTPARNLVPTQPVEKEDKMKHAEEIRLMMLEQKKAKLKKDDDKRAAVLERKKEQEMLRLEKLEEQRKKEEKAANFMRQQKDYKSPTRARLAVGEPRTPSSKSTAARKVFPTEPAAVPTPGRGPAKRGRIEVQGSKGKPTTVAEPTVKISPSRNLPRSNSRHPVVADEPMDIADDSPPPPVRVAKPKAKAKRSHHHHASSSASGSAADAAANAKIAEAAIKAEVEANAAAILQADQERYLKQMADEEKARRAAAAAAAEEKQREEEFRRREKKAAEEKAEAARRYQEDEQAKLKAIEEKEANRLREQAEREEKELQETLLRQAEKKARQEQLGRTPPSSAYEMTPPRTYKAQSKNDYGLHDLNSDDETDQEDDPRKEVPAWADFAVVRESVRRQIAHPPFDEDEFFGEIEKPDLRAVFGDTIKIKKRGSSAVWKSPAAPAAHARSVLDEIEE